MTGRLEKVGQQVIKRISGKQWELEGGGGWRMRRRWQEEKVGEEAKEEV